MTRAIVAALGLLLLPGMAAAQRDPELKIRVGQEVWVGIDGGRTLHGAVEAITADQVTIGNAQRAILRRGDILQVRVRDGIRDGIILGAVAGGSLAFFTGPLCDDGHCTAEPVVLMAAVGAGLGALLDSMTSRKLVYDRARTRVAIAPIIGRGRAGLGLGWSWTRGR